MEQNTLPPVVRFELEWGDRRAFAELPADFVTADQIEAATSWLTGLSNDWTIR